MEQAKLDMYVMTNQKYFPAEKMMFLKEKLKDISQDSILFDRPISQNVAYPEDNLDDKMKELVTVFDINHLVDRDDISGSLAGTLSGGEKKRIDIVRTISKDRDIYLFDEPTNDLDPVNVERVLEQIKNLALSNKIVIVVSHDKRCVNIADEIVKL